MTTHELAGMLTDAARVDAFAGIADILQEAAERLETLDERIAIMTEGNGDGLDGCPHRVG